MTGADALGLFYSSLAVSLPTFGWVIFGLLLYRVGVLSESLNAVLSRLSFNFGLPLILVCIGSSLTLSRLYRAGLISWEASVWRLCSSPLLCVMLALGMGVRGEELGVLFLLIASPVAASSYVMVVAARGNGILAANMVVLMTLLSVFTITVGFFLLSLFSLVG